MEKVIAQTPSPLPPPPDRQILSSGQWSILAAIFDTIVAPIVPAENADDRPSHILSINPYGLALSQIQTGLTRASDTDQVAVSYLAESASSCLTIKESIDRLLAYHLNSKQRQELLFVLSALEYDVCPC